jgi:replicative DNA helicase
MLDVARHAAVKDKIPVGMFSLEMGNEELGDRLLVSQSGIDAWRLKTGKLEDEDFDKLQEAMGVLADAPIYIDDTPGISIMEMRTKARRLQMEHGCKLILVDYLQLMDAGRRFDNRVQEVSIISQSLKNLARELRVPVLCASQLSRAVEARGSKKPQLSDLRESGSIEQDADVVMFLYRSDETKDMAPSDKIPTTLSIDKHRNGALKEMQFMLHGSKQQFRLMSKTSS